MRPSIYRGLEINLTMHELLCTLAELEDTGQKVEVGIEQNSFGVRSSKISWMGGVVVARQHQIEFIWHDVDEGLASATRSAALVHVVQC